MTIKNKITIHLLILMLFGILLINIIFIGWYISIKKLQNITINKAENIYVDGAKKEIQTATHLIALDISNHIKDKPKYKQISITKNIIEDIRFGQKNNRYFYVYDYEGNNIAHPILKDIVGNNLLDLKDKTGKHVIKILLKTSSRGGGFVDFYWPNPVNNNIEKKIGYVEPIPYTNFWIGSGIYYNDILQGKNIISNEINKYASEDLYFFLYVSLLGIAIFVTPLCYIIYSRSLRIEKRLANRSIQLSKINKKLKTELRKRKKAESALKAANCDLERMALVDCLTQVGNRRSFEEDMIQDWKQAIRNKESLAVLLCDVDWFKAYNDIYGHQKGDRCLASIAKNMKNCLLRPKDKISRYGGEEFALILPQTCIEGAKHVAQRLCRETKKLQIEHLGSKTAHVVTLSIGASATVPTQNLDMDQLILAADRALYQAKKKGRDRAIAENFINGG